MRTVLILNPTSGDSPMASSHGTIDDVQERILSSLRTYSIEPEIHYTTEDDPGIGIARQVASTGADLVIAAGGDGTLHAVASGLIHTRSTLGILPLGTMNNIARSLQIPEEIEQACKIIATGVTSQIDVGMINDQVFLEVAGIGLEAALFPAAEELKKKGIQSTLKGIWEGLVTLSTFQPTRFSVSFDDKKSRNFRAVQLSICNSPYYGARLQFAPGALMNDGFLDALIYRNFSKFTYLCHAISISQGRRLFEPRVSRRKVRKLTIDAEQPVVIHADGEQLGYTPAIVTIETGALAVRVPAQVAAGPNITKRKRKQPRLSQDSPPEKIVTEEKGSLHVKA